jgi:hypothetical protein
MLCCGFMLLSNDFSLNTTYPSISLLYPASLHVTNIRLLFSVVLKGWPTAALSCGWVFEYLPCHLFERYLNPQHGRFILHGEGKNKLKVEKSSCVWFVNAVAMG